MARVAIIDGVRTPFVKAGGHFKNLSMQELGVHALKALVQRQSFSPEEINEFVFSTVLLDPRTPNWAREILFKAGLPKTVSAHSVSNNCISGLVAVSYIAERIASQKISVGIAGGSESMSKPTLVYKQIAQDAFLNLFSAKTLGDKAKYFAAILNIKNLFPEPPSPKEPSTGLTMGQHMEITAKELGISRAEQDKVAFASHVNAAKAIKEGLLAKQVAPVAGVSKDSIVREDTTVEKLSTLKPVFDRSERGTLTAGNSSPLTDGASTVLLMSEEKAQALKCEPLAYIKDYEFSAIDPNKGLLMAPGVAVPKLLKRLGLTFDDFDLIEIHEAFAAQVLANIKAWEEELFGEKVGKVSMSKVNVLGGSIAIGHPFAATGGRIVTTLANELKRRNLKRGLISICAAGAMAGAMVIER